MNGYNRCWPAEKKELRAERRSCHGWKWVDRYKSYRDGAMSARKDESFFLCDPCQHEAFTNAVA